MLYLNKLWCDYRQKLGFDSIECGKVTASLVITATFKKKKGESGKSKLGIKISRGRKNTSLYKLWFLVPFLKMNTSEEATRGLEAVSFCCSDVIILIKRLKSNTFARWENASDRALVVLISFA